MSRTGRREVTPKQLANLKPFKKGESGNPNGKPALYPGFLKAMRERSPKAIELIDEALNSEDAWRQQWAVQQVLDRAWGKAPQAITGEGGEGGVVFVAIDTGIRRNRPALIEGKE